MTRPINKQAIFGNRRITSPLSRKEVPLNAFQAARGGRPDNKYLQIKDASLAGLDFLAQQRNQSVLAAESVARVDIGDAHEAAYQTAKTHRDTMNNPDAWEYAADSAAQAAMEKATGSGNIFTNWLSGVTNSNERLDNYRKSLRRNKIEDLQKGRVDARKRHHTETVTKNIASLQRKLLDPDIGGDSSASGKRKFDIARASAANDFLSTVNGTQDSPNSGILNDKQLGAVYTKSLIQTYADAIGGAFFDHIVRYDPQNARSYISLLDDIASNPLYSEHINQEALQKRKVGLHGAEEFAGNIAIGEGSDKESGLNNTLQRLQKQLTQSSGVKGGDSSASLKALRKLGEHTDKMLAATFSGKDGSQVLLYTGSRATAVQAVYDTSAKAILNPMYDKMALDWLTLTGNENAAGPETLSDAADYIHSLRTKDPAGFFALLNTLSVNQQNIYNSRIATVIAAEKGNANTVVLKQRKDDLLYKMSSDMDALTIDLRSTFGKLDHASSANDIVKLQEFLNKYWKDGLLRRFSEKAVGVMTPPEIDDRVRAYRKQLGESLQKAITTEGSGVEILDSVYGDLRSYPILASILNNSGGEGAVATASAAKVRARIDQGKSAARAQAKAIGVYIADGRPIPEDLLRQNARTLMDLARGLGLGPASDEAIQRNILGTAGFYSALMDRVGSIGDNLAAVSYSASIEDATAALALIERVQFQIDNPGAGSITIASPSPGPAYANPNIVIPRLPAQISILQEGSDSGGGVLSQVRGAIEQERGRLTTLINQLDPNNARLFEGNTDAIVMSLRQSAGLNKLIGVPGGAPQTVRDLALNNPAGEHGARYRAVLRALPGLAMKDGEYLKSALSGRQASDSHEDAKVNLEMGAMASSIVNTLSDNSIGVPPDLQQVSHAWETAYRSSAYGPSDYTGRAALMSRIINRTGPDSADLVDAIPADGSAAGQLIKRLDSDPFDSASSNTASNFNPLRTIFGSDVEVSDKVVSVLKKALGGFTGLMHSYKYLTGPETVRDDNLVEMAFVMRGLEKIKSAVKFNTAGFEAYITSKAQEISQAGRLRGDIGASSMVTGAGPELSPTSVIIEHPPEGNTYPSFNNLAKSVSPKHALQNKSAILKSLATIEAIQKGMAQGITVQQLRRGFDIGDIKNAFEKGNLGKEPVRYFAKFVNDRFRSELGEDFFSEKELARIETISPSVPIAPLIGERGAGVWGTSENDPLADSVWQNITNNGPPNGVRIVPNTISGPGSPARKFGGMKSYTVEFIIPAAQIPLKTKIADIRDSLLGGGLTSRAKRTTVTLTNWTAGNPWDKNVVPESEIDTLRGKYMGHVISHMQSLKLNDTSRSDAVPFQTPLGGYAE